MSQREKNYRACIPFYILYDLDLNANHLRLFGQIEQMESNPNPKCQPIFSYQWIAEELGINRRNAIKLAALLKQKNYIERTCAGKDKNNQDVYLWRTKKSDVMQINEGVVSPSDTPLVSLCDTPPVSPSDTDINNQKIKESSNSQSEVRLPVFFPKIKPYIDIWNHEAEKYGGKRFGLNQRQLKAVNANLDIIRKKWEHPLTPENFKAWLTNSIQDEYYMITKFKNKMDVCIRWEHFEEAYNETKQRMAA